MNGDLWRDIIILYRRFQELPLVSPSSGHDVIVLGGFGLRVLQPLAAMVGMYRGEGVKCSDVPYRAV